MNIQIVLPLLLTFCIFSGHSNAKRFFNLLPSLRLPQLGSRPNIHELSSSKQLTDKLEKDILFVLETKIRPIAKELTNAMGGKEMQEAANQQLKKQQQRRFGRKPLGPRLPFNSRQFGRRPLAPRTPFNRRPFVGRPFTTSQPFGFGARPPFGFGTHSQLGRFSRPTIGRPRFPYATHTQRPYNTRNLKNLKQTALPSTKSTLKKTADNSDGKFYGSSKNKKDNANIVRNVRRNLAAKMSEINKQIDNTNENVGLLRSIGNVLVPQLGKELEALKNAARQLDTTIRNTANKDVYKRFLPHLLKSFPYIARDSGKVQAFQAVLDEIKETVGQEVVSQKSKRFLEEYIGQKRNELQGAQRGQEAQHNQNENLQKIIEELQAVQDNFPFPAGNTQQIDNLIQEAQRNRNQ